MSDWSDDMDRAMEQNPEQFGMVLDEQMNPIEAQPSEDRLHQHARYRHTHNGTTHEHVADHRPSEDRLREAVDRISLAHSMKHVPLSIATYCGESDGVSAVYCETGILLRALAASRPAPDTAIARTDPDANVWKFLDGPSRDEADRG